MIDILIIGAGGHSKVVLDAIQPNDSTKITFLVQSNFFNPEMPTINDIRVKILDDFIPSESQRFICAIGSIADRKKIFQNLFKLNWSPQSIIHSSSIVSSKSTIGIGSYIGANTIINPDAKIGRNCIVNTGAIVEHDCEVGAHSNISPRAVLCGSVKIGKSTLVGAGAVILPGIDVGDNCIIGAGAVVISNVEASTKVVGVPAN